MTPPGGPAEPSPLVLEAVLKAAEVAYAPITVDGQPAVVTFLINVGEQRATAREAKETAQRLAQLIAQTPDAVVISRRGVILEANPAAARILGVESAQQLLGLSLAQFVDGEDGRVMEERMASVARGEHPGPPHSYRATRADGQRVLVEIASFASEYGGEPAIIAFGRDVTDRERMQEELARTERLAALGTLAAGAAHETGGAFTAEARAFWGAAPTPGCRSPSPPRSWKARSNRCSPVRADQRLRASAVVVGLSLVLIASGCRRGPTLDQEALRQTAAHARPLDPKDLAAPGREVVSLRSRGDRLCLSRVRAELGQRVELCGSTTAAGPQTVVIAGRAGDREWERELSVAGRVYAGTNSDAALGDGAFFAAWVEATGGSEVIRVVTLASGTGEVQHDERLYGQPWGLQLLSIGLHRPSGVLLLAWKDISTASSSGALMLGAFPLATRKASAAREIFRGDGWEKSSPQFLANGDELALTVSTGQRFGAMSHAGKAALGLAFIEPDGGLGDYRYIAATQPVRQVLGIGVDRLVMYRPEGEPAAAIPFSEAWVVGKRRAAP